MFRVVGPISLGGALVFAFLLVYLHEHTVFKTLADLAGLGLVVSFFSFFVLWWVVGGFNAICEARIARRLAAAGVAASARIVRVKQTGGSVNDQPELEMLLRVEPPGREPYLALHCEVVEQLHLPRVQPECNIRVLVDPSEPAWMTIDAGRWETARGDHG
jgi:hypothetical protein